MGHGCWSADALTASRERATSRRLGSLARPAWLCVCWPVPAVEAFRLRDACWNPASSPGTNPPGVEALVVVEEGGARGGGVVRVGSEGLFKGLAVGLTVFRRCWQPPHGNSREQAFRCRVPSDAETPRHSNWSAWCLNAPSGAGCFLTQCHDHLPGAFLGCLNAPSGAGCFLTRRRRGASSEPETVLMHLLVLGAF